MTPEFRLLLPRRAVLRRHVSAAAAASTRPDPDERFLSVGRDPLRLLLAGGGYAVGAGVTSRALALDGQLGSRLAAATGRGIVVTNSSAHDARLRDQLHRGYGRADLVIWCPSFVEMTDHTFTRRWIRDLQDLLVVAPAPVVLVVELPLILGDSPTAAAARTVIARINHRLATARRTIGEVAIVTPPPVQLRPFGQPLLDADHYYELGQRAAAVACPIMHACATAAVTAATARPLAPTV